MPCWTVLSGSWDGLLQDSALFIHTDLQEYMDLGPAYVEHVASLRLQNGLPMAVTKLSSTLFNYTEHDFLRVVEPLEMLALLHCIATLVRRCGPLTVCNTCLL